MNSISGEVSLKFFIAVVLTLASESDGKRISDTET